MPGFHDGKYSECLGSEGNRQKPDHKPEGVWTGNKYNRVGFMMGEKIIDETQRDDLSLP